jgi:hypothetical protein
LRQVIVISFYPNNIADNAVGGFDWGWLSEDKEANTSFIKEVIMDHYESGYDCTIFHMAVPDSLGDDIEKITAYIDNLIEYREIMVMDFIKKESDNG